MCGLCVPLLRSMPKLYIIAGCNGAGKTTASYTVLPEMLGCREFVNADEIAKGLSPFNPESVAIEAGRLMLQRMDDLLARARILRTQYSVGCDSATLCERHQEFNNPLYSDLQFLDNLRQQLGRRRD